MFTPPPSPRPFTSRESPAPAALPPLGKPMEDSESSLLYPSSSTHEGKRRAGRRYRWAVLVVPVLLILLTAYKGYVSSTTDSTTSTTLRSLSWHGLVSEGSTSWRPHLKRHPSPEPEPDPQSPSPSASPSATSSSASSSSSSSPSSSSTATASQTIPTIPASPPVLPTPFPQPFDDIITSNFTSVSCATFFSNMTSATPFRSCRPFSLLGTSDIFNDAQNNLTLMNSLIWGTCNTNIAFDQCKVNMGWFASTLKTACSQELSDQNSMAVTTLMGLNSFSVMHDVACIPDPTSNTYCYINAVRNPNPSDLYYYSLPLGIPLPKSAQPTCSSCSKSIMGKYQSALADPVAGPGLTGLKATYTASAALSVQLCGAAFLPAAANVTSAAVAAVLRGPSWVLIGGLGVLVWMLSGSNAFNLLSPLSS